jgi:hypothetical protein
MLAVSGPLYEAGRAMVAAEIAGDQLTASYLAQEGIEYMRMMRDDEYLAAYQNDSSTASSKGWTNFITSSRNNNASMGGCFEQSFCTLDPTQPMGMGYSLQSCSGSSCPPLYLLNGVYTQQQLGAATPFTRAIHLDEVPGYPNIPDRIIVSTVTWNFQGTVYSVSISEHLTPWQ